MSEATLAQRKARAGIPRIGQEERFVRVYQRGDCPTCFATGKEPCISMTSGRKTREHHGRTASKVVPRFLGEGNRLSTEGLAAEAATAPHHIQRDRRDMISYDPSGRSQIPKGGAYITFIEGGGPAPSAGGYRHLRPGHTHFAKWAPETVEGFNRHGQYQVVVQTEHGPAWLFPYEYVVLEPEHLWHLVKDGTLILHPKGMGQADLGERVFYLQTRGLPLEEAVLLALGKNVPDIGWFEPAKELSAMWWKLQSIGLTPMQKDKIVEMLKGFA